MRCDHIPVDNDLFHISTGWDLVHHVEEDILDNGTEPSRPSLLLECALSSGVEGIIGEDEFDPVKL